MSTPKRRQPAPDHRTPFALPAAEPAPADVPGAGTPRLRRVNRQQFVFRA